MQKNYWSIESYSKIKSDSIYRSKHSETKGKGLKILTPKQMLQRLPITLAQVKASNNSESLLNKIRKIVYSLYQSKQITKKVHNNIIKSVNILKWILYLWIQKTVKHINHIF